MNARHRTPPCWSAEPLESRRLFAADLVGAAITVAGGGHPINASDPHQVTVTVKNQNGIWFLDDAGTFQVNVYLSDDSTISGDADSLVGAWTVDSLGAGQTISQTLTLSLPSADPFRTDNQYYLGAIVDATNQVAESNESNNANRGDGVDRVAIGAERHLLSPNYTGGQLVGAEQLNIGSPMYGIIGGDFEWMGGYDIDTYQFTGAAGNTVAFDLDTTGGNLNSYMRIYRDNAGTLEAANDDGAAPGEPTATTDSFLTYTIPASNTLYYLVVSSSQNHASDPSLMSGRAAGSQGSFVINSVVLPPVPSFPDLVVTSDTGVSQTDNVTRDNTPTFTFVGTPGLTGQLLVNGSVAGAITDTAGTGLYTVTAPALADGTYLVSARMFDASTGYPGRASAPIPVIVDTTAPTLQIPMSFYYAGAPQQVTMRFSEDVGPSLTPGNMGFQDLASPAIYDANLSYSSATHDAAFSVQGPGVLPEGNYRAVLDGSRVTDIAGNTMSGAATFNFFVLPGDANYDRHVDLTDFTVLAANFNKTGRDFTQGNFNYDAAGKVDLTDFTILAANFNRSLAPATQTMTTAARSAAPSVAARASAPAPLFADMSVERLVDAMSL
jgi:hypothetical protein